MDRRIACVLIPNFHLTTHLMERTEVHEQPIVIADTSSYRSSVLYTNCRATEEGVYSGMTVVQAKNICPELCVLIKDEKKERRRFDELLRNFLRFSPFIEEAKPGIVYLDVSGFRRTYPHEKDLAEELISFVRGEGYPVKVGIAGNKFTSLVAASTSDTYSYTIVPNGEERKFLESQPTQLLPIDRDQYERLYRLGIRTLGQFAILPDNEVAERFGLEGARFLKLARGEDDEPLKPKEFDDDENQIKELESPLGTQIGILFYVNSILERKLGELARKGLACEKVLVILKTEDNGEIPVHISVAHQTGKAKAFIDLLRLELEKVILPSPVKEIRLRIERTSPLSSEQLSLYHRKGASLLNHIFTRLKRVLGNGNILSPQITLSHKPEGKSQLFPFTLGKDLYAGEKGRKQKAQSQAGIDLNEPQVGFSQNSISGFRLYDPPKPATVRAENGTIKFIIADSWYGEVTGQKGPWEISGEWWSEGYQRSYFEIQLSGGEEYLIFFDTSSRKWFLQGIFD
jgi:nucleotidyltransferase/DNA polymerase involved in DNA repair